MTEPSYRQNPRTAGRVIDGVAFIVTPDDNKLHSLNTTGTEIWVLTESIRSLTQVAEGLSRRFRVDEARARDDASRFCADLCERGILERVT
jgi:hypothetical protein